MASWCAGLCRYCPIPLPSLLHSPTVKSPFLCRQCTVPLPSMHYSSAAMALFLCLQCTFPLPPLHHSTAIIALFLCRGCSIPLPPLLYSPAVIALFLCRHCSVPLCHRSMPLPSLLYCWQMWQPGVAAVRGAGGRARAAEGCRSTRACSRREEVEGGKGSEQRPAGHG